MNSQSFDSKEPGGYPGNVGYNRTNETPSHDIRLGSDIASSISEYTQNGLPYFCPDTRDLIQSRTIRPKSTTQQFQKIDGKDLILTKRVLQILSTNVPADAHNPVGRRRTLPSMTPGMRFKREDKNMFAINSHVRNVFPNESPSTSFFQQTEIKPLNSNRLYLCGEELGPSTSKVTRPTSYSSNFATIDPSSISLFDGVQVKLEEPTEHQTNFPDVPSNRVTQDTQNTFPELSGSDSKNLNPVGVMSQTTTPQPTRVTQQKPRRSNQELRTILVPKRNIQNGQLSSLEKIQIQKPRSYQTIGNSQYQNIPLVETAQFQILNGSRKRYSTSDIFEVESPKRKNPNKTEFTYYQLAALSILNAPAGYATVAEMYPFILKHFDCFEVSSSSSWRSSLRHVLYKKTHFEKVEGMVNASNGAYYKINESARAHFITGIRETANKYRNKIEVLRLRNPDNLDALLKGTAEFESQAPAINGNVGQRKKTRSTRVKRSQLFHTTTASPYDDNVPGPSRMEHHLDYSYDQMPQYSEQQASITESPEISSLYFNETLAEPYNIIYGSEHSRDSVSTSTSGSTTRFATQHTDPYAPVQDQADPLAEFFIMPPMNDGNETNLVGTEQGGLGEAEEYMNYGVDDQQYNLRG